MLSEQVRIFLVASCPLLHEAMSNGSVKVSALNLDTYRKLIKFLNDKKAAYYTYQMKGEKSYRVVIRNLRYSISEADITEALKDKGYEIRSVTNIRKWPTKEPRSLFFVLDHTHTIVMEC